MDVHRATSTNLALVGVVDDQFLYLDPFEKWGRPRRKLSLRSYKPLRIERPIHGVLLDTLHFLQLSKRQNRRWLDIEFAGALPAIHFRVRNFVLAGGKWRARQDSNL